MLRFKRASFFLSFVVAVAAMAGIGFTSHAYAQSDKGAKAFGLGTTVLIDSRGTAYFSTPDGAITAVRLDSGAQLWTTPKGKVYKPLAISGKLLVLQQELDESATGKHLGITGLRLSDGSEQFAAKIELPSSAWASVKDGLGASLKTRVVTASNNANNKITIAWASERRVEMRGMDADEEEKNETDNSSRQSQLQQSKSDAENNSGAVEIDLNGNVTLLDGSAKSLQFAQAAEQELQQDLTEEQRLKGLAETQYASTDRNHILVSELVGDEREMNKYQWTIYSGASRQPLGTISSPFPTAPFYVSGSTLIYQLRPFAVRDSANRMTRSPLKLIAIDLKTGNKLWEQAILDTEYYGPFPP
ncbi:MAG TPA: hypothetical protein PLD20_26035 [Blastocatellia bacterium]|nr:hypothetical protein [Blastocatellia bacterium]HMV85587.1 hypothetical protein [Blastocatellia bacterium]HMX27999.1 hypothetical protein [Blastocatellia bacterium]HMY74701.1 hypothetical protein [Blastocatellia bacterium]HMZ21420.1 hypothetical protein [Blastocatellia bacterium]